MPKNYEKDIQDLITQVISSKQIEQFGLDCCDIDLYAFLLLLKKEATTQNLISIILNLYSSVEIQKFSIRERYDVLYFILSNDTLHSILRSIVEKVTDWPIFPPDDFVDITDILKSKHVTTKDRLVMLNRQAGLFVSTVSDRNSLYLAYRAERGDVSILFSSLFAQIDKYVSDENESQHIKTSILMTYATESINKYVLRYLTTLIKYNFGTLSLRGVIQHTNRFYNELDQDGKNFIMFHNDSEFVYDI